MSEEGEKKLCPRCFNVGSVLVRPDQIGWLRRPEFETEQEKRVKARTYEQPEGQLYCKMPPYEFRVPCPACYPRHRDPFANLLFPKS